MTSKKIVAADAGCTCGNDPPHETAETCESWKQVGSWCSAEAKHAGFGTNLAAWARDLRERTGKNHVQAWWEAMQVN